MSDEETTVDEQPTTDAPPVTATSYATQEARAGSAGYGDMTLAHLRALVARTADWADGSVVSATGVGASTRADESSLGVLVVREVRYADA